MRVVFRAVAAILLFAPLVAGSGCGAGPEAFATPADDPAGAPDDADDDGEWPREFDAENANVVVYQPQIDSYQGGTIEAHSALSVVRGDEEPVFGAVWFTARVRLDRDAMMAEIYDARVPRAHLPDATAEQDRQLADLVRTELPRWVHPISMDRLLPALAAVETRRAAEERLRADPPRIVVETTPSLLVPIDGDARLGPIAGSRIDRVVNTPVELLFEPTTRTYWIDGGPTWLYASNVDGPYRRAESVPPEIAAVRTSNEDDATRGDVPSENPTDVPHVVVSHEPTELIVFDGEPRWATLVDDELFYASNTATAVFRIPSEDAVYVVLAGRWYRAKSLRGAAWEFVDPGRLPDVFARIPEDSEVGGVLAHVPGTDLAEEALRDAEMPQTSAVDRAGATCTVTYDDEPDFEPIVGTDLAWASDTTSQVLRWRDTYYCCDQGVWFTSRSAYGPWLVADSVPAAIDLIPPDNPCFNVKYVRIYDATPTVVYVGYTPGYLGCYPWHRCVVWGTGWRYSGWSHRHWYPRCATWGTSVAYQPWSARWHKGLALRCRGGWRVGLRSWRGWGYGGGWWGPSGYRPRRVAAEPHRPVVYRPNFDAQAMGDRRTRGVNLYRYDRNRARNAPDPLASRPRSRLPGRAPQSGDRAPPASIPRPQRGERPRDTRPRDDVYSDRDGRVYRRDGDGRWQRRTGRTWEQVPATREPASPPPPPPQMQERPPRERAPQPAPERRPATRRPPTPPAPSPSLERDAHGRDRGAVRSRDRGAEGGGRKDREDAR